jgi:prenyltransferase beta subunit
MLQVARLAPTLLGESAGLVSAFLSGSVNPDGGFRNRGGESDLYYTVFGLDGLIALAGPVPASTRRFLERFEDGASLDLVHLTCLARCWASVSSPHGTPAPGAAILRHLETFRTPDGGYAVSRGAAEGTVYACFLALGAVEDLHASLPEPDGVVRCVAARRAADGGFANVAGALAGSTPTTAAAVMILRHLDGDVDPSVRDWLLARCHRDGGFLAAPGAPMPDLLSTATALHALSALGTPLAAIGEPCLDFVDTLWTNAGGFHGSWADDVLDCEYTYYGLLALGHLSLEGAGR